MIKFRKKYPTIIFATDGSTDINELRQDISDAGIYFHTADFSSARSLLPTADILVVYSADYSSPAIALLDFANRSKSAAKVIYIGRSCDVQQCEKVDVIPPIASAIISELSLIMKVTFNIDPAYAEDDEIVCELAKPAQVYYNGTKLLLSRSEAKIVHFLLTLEPRLLVSKETIGEYLALASGAVPVHIHNINDKAMKSYHDKLVFSRSSRGYFVY